MATSTGICVAVDAMGGDFAPNVNLKGALSALEADESLRIALCGDEAFLRAEWKKLGSPHSQRVEFAHAEDVISMEDSAASAVRKKKNSSIHVGLNWVREERAHAFLSAGNSGAIMAASLLLLKRIPGVDRPAILIRLPTADGYVIILDAGANVDCRPRQLSQFTKMGSTYAEHIEGIEFPRIGLLSNGSESHKGNELTRETDGLLKKSDLNYIGYVEGFDIFRGRSDVVVCDGFVGNVILKLSEGLAETTFQWFRTEIKRDFLGMMGFLLMKKLLRNFQQKFDYQPYGAAPLMGINGMVMISHGSSTEIAIHNGILMAKKGVEQNFVSKMASVFDEKDEEDSPLNQVESS